MKKLSSILVLNMMLIITASCHSEQQCLNKYMNNHKFFVIRDGRLTGDYFAVHDSAYLEYANNSFYSQAHIQWLTCSTYQLIMRNLRDDEDLFKVGDTLFVEVKAIHNDTLNCVATAFNFSAPIRMLRVKF